MARAQFGPRPLRRRSGLLARPAGSASFTAGPRYRFDEKLQSGSSNQATGLHPACAPMPAPLVRAQYRPSKGLHLQAFCRCGSRPVPSAPHSGEPAGPTSVACVAMPENLLASADDGTADVRSVLVCTEAIVAAAAASLSPPAESSSESSTRDGPVHLHRMISTACRRA